MYYSGTATYEKEFDPEWLLKGRSTSIWARWR